MVTKPIIVIEHFEIKIGFPLARREKYDKMQECSEKKSNYKNIKDFSQFL